MLSYSDLLDDLGKPTEFKTCGVPSKYSKISKTTIIRNTEPIESTDCKSCNVEMDKLSDEYTLVCPKCGCVVEIGNSGEYTIGAGEGHNTSSNAYMSFKPVGMKGRLYHNAMVKYTSVYNSYRDSQVHKVLSTYNFANPEFKIPGDILKAAGDLFIKVRDLDTAHIRRGMSRRGLLGACILAECNRVGVAKTMSQIAKMMDITESRITSGIRELQIYFNQGVIDIPQNTDPSIGFINAYFEDFKIADKYKKFALALLKKLSTLHNHAIESKHVTTKCIGVVYLISQSLGLGLTHEQIASKCDNICRGTYLSVYNEIIKSKSLLTEIFTKYKMKFPQ